MSNIQRRNHAFTNLSELRDILNTYDEGDLESYEMDEEMSLKLVEIKRLSLPDDYIATIEPRE